MTTITIGNDALAAGLLYNSSIPRKNIALMHIYIFLSDKHIVKLPEPLGQLATSLVVAFQSDPNDATRRAQSIHGASNLARGLRRVCKRHEQLQRYPKLQKVRLSCNFAGPLLAN